MYLKTSLTAGNVIKKAVVGFFVLLNELYNSTWLALGYLMYDVCCSRKRGKTYENLF